MLHDKQLEVRLFSLLRILEREVDAVGPTPLRHDLSEAVVHMRRLIWDFDQGEYERLPSTAEEFKPGGTTHD